MKNKIIAKAVILNDNGEVLLLKRSQTDDSRPGDWDFPGGGIEDGEEITSGIAREIDEEANIVVEPKEVRLLYAATQFYEDSNESVTRLLFLAKTASSQVKLSFEHEEYRWVSPERALELFPHPFYGKGLAYARDHDLLAS